MRECSKSVVRRLHDINFTNRYFVGKGLDIGGKPDPLSLYKNFFAKLESVKTWDLEDGDAQFLEGVENNSYDFIHSSHCLEHLLDPHEGLQNWFRVVKPNGYLVITIPDEDLYEQGIFPSSFNADHKWSFTIYKEKSWSKRSINVLDLVLGLGEMVEIIKIECLNSTFRYDLPRFDQTVTPVTESAIEIILRRRNLQEISDGGRLPISSDIDIETTVHLNQYSDDIKALKKASKLNKPFQNTSKI